MSDGFRAASWMAARGRSETVAYRPEAAIQILICYRHQELRSKFLGLRKHRKNLPTEPKVHKVLDEVEHAGCMPSKAIQVIF